MAMNIQEVLEKAQDTVTAADSGGGVGYGVRARPVGAFVIKDGDVRWEPAIDATRLALRGMLIPIVGMVMARSIVKTIVKHRR
jgi:uncharacterized spore protein YtfJ